MDPSTEALLRAGSWRGTKWTILGHGIGGSTKRWSKGKKRLFYHWQTKVCVCFFLSSSNLTNKKGGEGKQKQKKKKKKWECGSTRNVVPVIPLPGLDWPIYQWAEKSDPVFCQTQAFWNGPEFMTAPRLASNVHQGPVYRYLLIGLVKSTNPDLPKPKSDSATIQQAQQAGPLLLV